MIQVQGAAGGVGSGLEGLVGGNALLSGGLLLMLAGAALSLLYRLLPVAWSGLVRSVTVSVEVRDETVFVWLGGWLQSVAYGARCRRLSVDVEHPPRAPDGRPSAPRAILAPGPGVHVFRYRGRWIWLERRRERVTGEGGAAPRDHYVLRALTRDLGFVKGLLEEAAERAERRRRGRVAVYGWTRYTGWNELQLQEGRGLDSVILPGDVKDRIVEDLRTFREGRAEYVRLGIPYRRGYLFHGPPGCGKTSFARALAAHFGMSIHLVRLSGAGMSDEALLRSLDTALPDGILLIEDVDAAFMPDRTAEGGGTRLTFSGLLNAVDGVAAQEGRVVIMTTNHRDRLDPALLRPGRVDVEQHLGRATSAQARALFLRFHPGQEALADHLARRVPDGAFSMADLQGILLRTRASPYGALREVLQACGGVVGLLEGRVG